MTDHLPPARENIAEVLGADPEAAAHHSHSGKIDPLTVAKVIRDLTRAHPLGMLALAFIAGAAYETGKRRR
jgi:hypothetical protein